jgi:hypothetical protein
MPYCRDCGDYITSNSDTYCYSCEQDIINRSRSSVNDACEDERRRICNDREYAHSWLQDAIGWIMALWDIISKIFSGGCYITTVVVERKGFNDDSTEMILMRKFRKEYIFDSQNDSRSTDLEQYYLLGQCIIRWVNSRSDANQIWDYISEYVFSFIELIKTHEFEKAYHFFKERTLNIRNDILTEKHKSQGQHY